mmetsp:Transcript_2096/g.4294  ORF Transcript_2096/g.4294 Transcript_2096/m.4294 type:complete len:201 (+) Transcript_2096:325-927(+)
MASRFASRFTTRPIRRRARVCRTRRGFRRRAVRTPMPTRRSVASTPLSVASWSGSSSACTREPKTCRHRSRGPRPRRASRLWRVRQTRGRGRSCSSPMASVVAPPPTAAPAPSWPAAARWWWLLSTRTGLRCCRPPSTASWAARSRRCPTTAPSRPSTTATPSSSSGARSCARSCGRSPDSPRAARSAGRCGARTPRRTC